MRLIVLSSLLFASVWGNPYFSTNDERIVGGITAPEGKYVYQVSLRTPNNSHFCGGSIISRNFILTAAHCVYGKSPNSMFVVTGSNYLYAGGNKYAVYQVIWNESFDPGTNVNDVALLRLNQNILFGPKVNAISLARSNPAPGTPCTLTGWGLTSYPSQQLPSYLQHISLYAISLQQCLTGLQGMPVTNTNVCTFNGYGQGSCKGDSGGPLAANGVQVGIVSWGIPCAKGTPDVFTSVAYFRNWIRSKSGI